MISANQLGKILSNLADKETTVYFRVPEGATEGDEFVVDELCYYEDTDEVILQTSDYVSERKNFVGNLL